AHGRGRGPYRERLGGEHDVEEFAVGLREPRDRGEPLLTAGADHAHRNLTAVRDEYLGDAVHSGDRPVDIFWQSAAEFRPAPAPAAAPKSMNFRRCGLEYFLPSAVAMLRTPVPVTAAPAVSPRIPLRLMKGTAGPRAA